MGLWKYLNRYKEVKTEKAYAKMMQGYIPVYSDFGSDIYASDIVQNAIRIISEEISKLQPRHIRIDGENGLQKVVTSDINRLLRFGPNPLMTTSDFLMKIVYMRETKKNAYIYPTWEKIDLQNGSYKRKYTGFYPLNPSRVDYMQNQSGELYITFHFMNGEQYTLPYADIIHWRKDYSDNDFQGGDENGTPNTKALLNLLNIDDMGLQSIEKGVKSSNAVNGVIKQNTMLDEEDLEKRKQEFEKKLQNNASGFLVTDLKNDFISIKTDPKFVPDSITKTIIMRILAHYGISWEIFTGNFTEEQYQAFYEQKLEPMLISLGRLFSRVLFTERELDLGNEIIFYQEGLMYMNTKNKIETATLLTNIGAITDNQILGIFGFAPFEGGDIRHQSLNYVNRELADQYQMANAAKRKGGPLDE